MSDLPLGSTILVTGASGYIGSHVVNQALTLGYRVRATVRSPAKGDALVVWADREHGPGKLEYAVVEDIAKEDAFVHAVKGVNGAIHLAFVLSFSGSWDTTIPPAIDGTLSILRAAFNEPSLKRIVITSSCGACGVVQPGAPEVQLDEKSWNDVSVSKAKAEGADLMDVIAASRVEAEKAAWNWVDKMKPHFVLNTILPNANYGQIIPCAASVNTGGWIPSILAGKADVINNYPPGWFIDVEDDPKLHLIALVDPEVNNERICAVTAPYTWNQILTILKKLKPTSTLPPPLTGAKDMPGNAIVDHARADELFRKHGWKVKTLEESILADIEGM